LEIRYHSGEVVTVNLGPEPIKIGCDRSCTVVARGAAPVAMRYSVREGKVIYEDSGSQQAFEAVPDQPRTLGGLTLTVHTATPGATREGEAPAEPQ
jgi:hypothetical protein